MSKQTIQDWLVQNFEPHKKCESPVEEIFDSAMQMLDRLKIFSSVYLPARLNHQYVVDNYRLDFAYEGEGEKGPYRIAIEIDGHDFHERTKEQASHDKQRDRYLQSKNWRVLRFTGSDVYRNPFACAQEVLDTIQQLHTGLTAVQAVARIHLDRLEALLRGDA